MRRLFILCPLLSLLLCSGCQRGIYANYRDVAKLRPVQTLGFDYCDSTVTVSVAAGEGRQEDPPMTLSRQGDSIETALAALKNAFPEALPYFGHIQYIILGRQAAEDGMERWLTWMERNPELRLDAAVFIARGDAGEMVLHNTESNADSAHMTDITEELHSLELLLTDLGEGNTFTVRALASSLSERGSALCSAIRFSPSEGASAIAPAGFALFSDGRLCGFIEEDNAPAVLLFSDNAHGARILLETADGGAATVKLDSGRAKASVHDGTAQVYCHVRFSLLEGSADDELLEAALAETLSAQLDTVIDAEKNLNCDFLNLCPGYAPGDLQWSLRVDTQLNKGYDLRQREDGR